MWMTSTAAGATVSPPARLAIASTVQLPRTPSRSAATGAQKSGLGHHLLQQHAAGLAEGEPSVLRKCHDDPAGAGDRVQVRPQAQHLPRHPLPLDLHGDARTGRKPAGKRDRQAHAQLRRRLFEQRENWGAGADVLPGIHQSATHYGVEGRRDGRLVDLDVHAGDLRIDDRHAGRDPGDGQARIIACGFGAEPAPCELVVARLRQSREFRIGGECRAFSLKGGALGLERGGIEPPERCAATHLVALLRQDLDDAATELEAKVDAPWCLDLADEAPRDGVARLRFHQRDRDRGDGRARRRRNRGRALRDQVGAAQDGCDRDTDGGGGDNEAPQAAAAPEDARP